MTEELRALHAQVDAMLPVDLHPRLNALMKNNPLGFYVDSRVKLPRGVTFKKLNDLQKKLHRAKEKANA